MTGKQGARARSAAARTDTKTVPRAGRPKRWASAFPILAVFALTLLPSAVALHFIYLALDTRYQRMWEGDAPQVAAPPADGIRHQAGAKAADLAGQLLMIGFDGTTLNERRTAALSRALREGRVGGVLLLEKNVTSPSQIRKLTASLQEAAVGGGQPPVLIAVDQEGGAVQRLNRRNGHPAASIPSAKAVAAKCKPVEARDVYRAVACELHRAGININLGPVVDLDIAGAKNPIIGGRARSYSSDAKTVTAFGAAFIEGHASAGLATSVKHFPGHGSSLTDSHEGFTDITLQFDAHELEPFRALAGDVADAPADMVMTGHLHHAHYATSGEPATLSKRFLSEILRRDMGFDGVIVSDDLEMGAIRERYGLAEAMIRALNAGVDLLIVSNTHTRNPNLVNTLYATLSAAIKPRCGKGEEATCVPEARIMDAHRRVLALKERLGARLGEPAGAVCAAVARPLAEVCTGAPEPAKPEATSWWSWFSG
jgi:beta-N-acetylhexosaminidase